MRNRITAFLALMNLVIVTALILTPSPAKGQDFPDGLVGLSSSSPGVLYRINESTGEATPLVTLDSDWSIVGLAYLGQTLYGTDLSCQSQCANFAVASISPNGSTSVLSEQGGSSNWWALAADETAGILYSIDNDSNGDVLVAQFPNGLIQAIGPGTGIEGAGMAYDDTNGILYAASNNASLYTVSTTNGTVTLIGSTGLAEGLRIGLEYDECNQILYLNDGNTGQLYTVDVNTGAATLVGSNNVGGEIIDGLAWKGSCEPPTPPAPEQIPTMSEWGLMIMAAFIGLAGILAYRKRRVMA